MKNSNKYIQFIVTLALALIANFLLSGFLKNSFGYIGEPLVIWGLESASSVKEFTNAFKNFNQVNEDLARTKAELAQKESDIAIYQLLQIENKSLKAQIGIIDSTRKTVEAQVLSGKLFENNKMILNKGKDGGVTKGSFAFSENYYIGMINKEPLKYTSEIILPSNNESYLQVLIIPEKKLEEIKKENTNVAEFSKGVMTGSINGATIENIPVASKVNVGDYVVLNDEKIGRYLYVGKVEKIEGDESQPTRKALVDPSINYSNLKYVFIEIK